MKNVLILLTFLVSLAVPLSGSGHSYLQGVHDLSVNRVQACINDPVLEYIDRVNDYKNQPDMTKERLQESLDQAIARGQVGESEATAAQIALDYAYGLPEGINPAMHWLTSCLNRIPNLKDI